MSAARGLQGARRSPHASHRHRTAASQRPPGGAHRIGSAHPQAQPHRNYVKPYYTRDAASWAIRVRFIRRSPPPPAPRTRTANGAVRYGRAAGTCRLCRRSVRPTVYTEHSGMTVDAWTQRNMIIDIQILYSSFMIQHDDKYISQHSLVLASSTEHTIRSQRQ